MTEVLELAKFVDLALRYPTWVFSLALAICAIYWLFVLVGAADLDLHGGHGADVAGADGSLDGGDGAHAGPLGRLFGHLGFDEVPITISMTVFALAGWLVSLVASETLSDWAASFTGGTLVALGAAVIATAATAVFVQPLKRFFRTEEARAKQSLVGQECEITTLRVDERHGQAEVADGGAGLVIQVRSSRPDELSLGARALIFDYDPNDDVFHVRALGTSDLERTSG